MHLAKWSLQWVAVTLVYGNLLFRFYQFSLLVETPAFLRVIFMECIVKTLPSKILHSNMPYRC